MKNHVQILFKYRMKVWSNLLSQSTLQSDAASWLLANDARTTLFYLESMTRLLARMHDGKKMTRLSKQFKLMEDSLGEMDYYAGLIKAFKGNRQIPADIIDHFSEKLNSVTFKTNKLLQEQGWLEQDNLLRKIKKSIRKIDWLNDVDFKKQLHLFYRNQLAKLTTQLAQPLTEIEAGVHELRRDIRWLSIYPQAFKGFVALRPARVTAQKWNKYLTSEIIDSPFNQLARVDDMKDVVELNRNPFYAMSWLISALGVIKDQGLSLLALTHAWHEVQKISIENAQELALAALGKGQATQTELLSAARTIVAQIHRDQVLGSLLVNS